MSFTPTAEQLRIAETVATANRDALQRIIDDPSLSFPERVNQATTLLDEALAPYGLPEAEAFRIVIIIIIIRRRRT